jgi:superfamily II DNA/RNA helicase
LLAVYGGAPIEKQIARIEHGVDMIVATPGRLIDLIDRKAVSVAGLEHVVVDEADRMADMGFLPQVEWILRHVERSHQTLLFSATLDGVVDTLIKRYQTDPSMHEIDSGQVTVEEMQHRFLAVHQMDKVKVSARIANSSDKTMMFTATKHGADRLAKALNDEGVDAAAIHGDLRQNLRERALRQFGDGELSVLVATDVAARGIHVDDVGTVIHYDPPQDHKTYLHRSGRTARAGATGLAVTLSLWDQELVIRQLQRRLGLESEIIEVFSNDDRLENLTELIPESA